MTDTEQDITGSLKGKGKEEDFDDDSSTPSGSQEHFENTAYPPSSEDAEETRRVQEVSNPCSLANTLLTCVQNLRRWEVAERQRRKHARGSQSGSGPSLVSDVSRRASLLWPGRKGKQSSISHLGTHTALASQDHIDTVPLTDINASPSPSPTRSRSNSEDTSTAPDPFANPSDVSPFDDSHASNATSSKTRVVSSGPSSHAPPPPLPINIPPPRSPPPVTTPPLATPPPRSSSVDPPVVKEPEVRWWHDWLCGCGEGPDRGGDSQVSIYLVCKNLH